MGKYKYHDFVIVQDDWLMHASAPRDSVDRNNNVARRRDVEK